MPQINYDTDDMNHLMIKYIDILSNIKNNNPDLSFFRLTGTRKNRLLVLYRDVKIGLIDCDDRTSFGLFGTEHVSDSDAANALSDLPRGTLYQPASDGTNSVYNYHPKWYVRKYIKGLTSFEEAEKEIAKAINIALGKDLFRLTYQVDINTPIAPSNIYEKDGNK